MLFNYLFKVWHWSSFKSNFVLVIILLFISWLWYLFSNLFVCFCWSIIVIHKLDSFLHGTQLTSLNQLRLNLILLNRVIGIVTYLLLLLLNNFFMQHPNFSMRNWRFGFCHFISFVTIVLWCWKSFKKLTQLRLITSQTAKRLVVLLRQSSLELVK